MPGRLIVLEGPDGAGTTLHSRLLAEALKRKGRDVLLTAEPSDGTIGTFIRVALASGSLPPNALQLLFTADRAEHLARVIKPALARGSTVVTDRYIASTIAYGLAQGLDANWLQDLNKNFIQPDRTLFLLPPLRIALERIRQRGRSDTLEQEGIQQRVHKAYASIAASNPSIIVIDTSADRDLAAQRIWNAINNCCNACPDAASRAL